MQRFHRAILHLEGLGKVLEFDHRNCSFSLSLDGCQTVLLAAVDAHGLHMNTGNSNQMGTLFGVEVVQIRLMLEVVGVYLTVLDDLVGDHIVVVLLDIQRDALGARISLHTSSTSQWGAGVAAQLTVWPFRAS